jgi:rod shape-determining protein MreB and related proteins
VITVRSGVAIDLGTVNTLVYVPGRGIIIDEPSAIGVDRATGAVVVVGQEADALTGKEAQDVEVLHPLRDGVIADLTATAAMLQAFLRRARVRQSFGGRPRCVVCLPGQATAIERQSVLAAVDVLRPRFAVQLVEEPVAAAAGAGIDLAAGTGAFVVDIGGGTTEIAVLAGSHVVRSRSLRVGGNAMDEAITRAVRKELGLLLGRDAARSLKMTLGIGESILTAETVGVDAARRTPRVEQVPVELVAEAVEPTVRAIVGSVTELLADIPPNLAEDVFRGKIRLAGGGALLPGLAFRIESAADIPASVVDDPLRCVIRGAAQILEHGTLVGTYGA